MAKSKNPPQNILEFEDNSLFALLVGEHDCNIARIEESLSVSLNTRGNQIAINGIDARAIEKAEAVLHTLYERLEKGMSVSMDEVDAAIRMATQSAKGKSGKGSEMKPLVSANSTIKTRQKSVSPRTPNQADYIDHLKDKDLVLGLGPAGTGKTFLAVAMGVAMMLEGKVERIVLSRPAVEAGESLGFLPGDLKEKIDPYLRPLYDALYEMLPAETVVKKLAVGEIEIAPLAFMRGRTLSHCFVILDEAQNTTPVQMKMFLTRLGEGSRMVLTGDLSQVDLPKGTRSGLRDAKDVVTGMKGVGITHFTGEDVVRHPLVTRIVNAYKEHDEKRGTSQAYG